MPTKKKSSSSTGNSDLIPFKGFVNYTPSDSDKKEFDHARSTKDIAGLYWARVCEAGYKLSTVYVEKNHCHSATLFCKDTASDFAGYCLSVRAGDPITAVERLLWVHCDKLREDWSNALVDDGQDW